MVLVAGYLLFQISNQPNANVLNGTNYLSLRVQITTPVEGATISGSKVLISATATANNRFEDITKVEFYLDETKIGEHITDEPLPSFDSIKNSNQRQTISFTKNEIINFSATHGIRWDSTNAANGPHILTAKAHDKAGNVENDSTNIIINN